METTSHTLLPNAALFNDPASDARANQFRMRRLQVLNSGDTAGDRRRVVGYGAFAFFETAPGTAAHAH